jgi:hypothetical protein
MIQHHGARRWCIQSGKKGDRMNIRRVVLAAALACGAPAAAAAAQTPPGGGADSAWVNLVTISRLRDEFAARPDEARLDGHPTRPWGRMDRPVVLPEPFRSRAFVGESYVLLDVDSAGRAAGCRPLRAGAHPELDAFACTLLMQPGYFAAYPPAPAPRPRESVAGRWVMGLSWESLTAAAYRQRPREGGVAAPPAPAPSQGPRRTIRAPLIANDYQDIADQQISDDHLAAELAINEEGAPTGCRVSSSSGNPAVDERTCALLAEKARFTQRIDASGTLIADTVTLRVNVGRMLSTVPPFAQPMQIGQTVSGRLESGDRVLLNGTLYDEYAFTAPSAMSLRITLRSAEFGPMLWVIHGSPPSVASVRTNDPRADVQRSVDVPAGTSVRVQVNTWARGMQGAYTLQVTAN